MSYTVAVQAGLSAVKDELEEQGYHVVSMEHTMEPVTAIIYSGVADYWAEIPSVERMEGVMSMGPDGPQDVLLINATGRQPLEVLSLLNGQLGGSNV